MSKKRKTIPNYVWILPRPRKHRYQGGFPLHFEKKLIELLKPKELVLHPFGGMAEYGIRVDINPEVDPDIFADAHYLPFKDNTFDLVICDPPYNEDYASKLYNSKKPSYKRYISEAVRVCKPGGFVVSYHWALTPRPHGTAYYCRIFIGGRIWHRPRVASVFQKEGEIKKEKENSIKNFIMVDKKFRPMNWKSLLSILACPVCKGDLEMKKDGLYCPKCDVTYPIKDNKPFLFPPKKRRKK